MTVKLYVVLLFHSFNEKAVLKANNGMSALSVEGSEGEPYSLFKSLLLSLNQIIFKPNAIMSLSSCCLGFGKHHLERSSSVSDELWVDTLEGSILLS